MKYAIKVAYFGDNFFGSQFQPNCRTVAGEILKALRSLGINSKLSFAGRTDAGVHALGQVVAFNSDFKITPRMLNSELPDDITAWASCEVPESFNPRKANIRVYSYVFYDENYDFLAIEKAVKLLCGTWDFSNFTKGYKGGRRTIYRAEIIKSGDFIIFEIEGNAFTWNMVRCIATALKLIGSGKDLDWFKKMLNPAEHRERVQPAPASGLLLKDVKYEGIKFEIDEYAKKLLNLRLKKRLIESGIFYKLFSLELEAFETGK
ncbi:MAG: tRNA pseudouridine(38-40) synthase TruA [Archaeoglobaceae archaeon]|nr:tRNA pseudouridine(38-40) synthase TruA [Archaeoglobaceae archaeon]MDW8118002.1 tRNA pseudouridine(38-40) synthase TruA [Archaeoglobaceae archaeon]